MDDNFNRKLVNSYRFINSAGDITYAKIDLAYNRYGRMDRGAKEWPACNKARIFEVIKDITEQANSLFITNLKLAI